MPSYPLSGELASTTGNAQAIIDAARQGLEPFPLETGKVYAIRDSSGGIKELDLTGDAYRATPARKSGTFTVRDTPSFLAYYAKHADDNSEVYADVERCTITAVLDANTSAVDGARWGRHRLVLGLRTTQAWREWIAKSSHLQDQEEFAEFIEDHLADLQDPAPAEMLEIAQSISGTTKAEFQSGTRLASGQRQLAYVETVTTKAGAKGDLVVPESFTIGVKIFEGAQLGDKVTARLRYRINGGHLKIGYKLERSEEALAAAFADVVTEISNGVHGGTVMNGTPA